MNKLENEQAKINSKQELPESLKNLPNKVAKMKAEVYKALGLATVAALILTSCAPEGHAQEIQPAVSQNIESTDSGSDSAPAIIDTGDILEAAATPEIVATPEFENMHDYCIYRAKQVGIDLENLENSNNFWITKNREFKGFSLLRELIDNNFTENAEYYKQYKWLIVVGLDSLNSQEKYDQAPTTAGNRKIMTWLEAVYKKSDGQYQMVLLPINVWSIDDELLSDKGPDEDKVFYLTDTIGKHYFNHIITDYAPYNYNPDFNFQNNNTISNLVTAWMGPGSVIRLTLNQPGVSSNQSWMLEEPIYTPEQMADFLDTGNADFFPYFMLDPQTDIKKPFIYPFENYKSSALIDLYQDKSFIRELKSWWTEGYWQDPNGPPCPQHWQALP